MNNEIAQLLMDLPVPGSPMRPSPPKSADEFMRGLSHSLYRDLENAASSVASALMAPSRAASGEYPLMIDPQTGVNYYDGMAEDAAGLAGLVSLGAAPIPRPMNSLGMGGIRSVADLEALASNKGVSLYLSENPYRISVSKIVVPENIRGGGVGTSVMNDVINYAQELGKPVSLTPSTDFGASSIRSLERFYDRLGFVKNTGRNKDYSISDTMIRPPR